MNHGTLGLPIHYHLPEFTQTHVHRVRDAIQPSHPRSSPSPDPIPPSIRVFSNESTLCMRWPKYWSFSLFPAISKARFDFQKQAAYHQQICHNEHCKSLPLRIHKTNHKVATCDFLISLSQTQLRRQDIHMVYHWQFFIKTTQQYHRKKICD